MDPSVDVVMPTYNGATTIESAIASIQAQTIDKLRIIVVNDGSVDDTKEIVSRLAAADNRIVLLEQPNSGIVDALNLGLTATSAEFVARHDDDDLASPDWISNQRMYLSAHPECAAVAGAIRHIDEAGQPLGGSHTFPSPDLANLERYPQLEPYLPHPFLMMRRAAIGTIGGYRHVFHAEDTDLYWRLQETGRLYNLAAFAGDYRVHTKSITGTSVVNGRISAVNSQLAGLSAVRRRTKRSDLNFPKSLLADYQKAVTLDRIIRVGSRDLDVEEKARLAVSACAKLLELAGHRPYELEPEDCAFIGKTLLPALKKMPPGSREYCFRLLSGTSARLASAARTACARKLTPLQLYPAVVAKLTLRLAMPPMLRRSIRHVIRRDGFVK